MKKGEEVVLRDGGINVCKLGFGSVERREREREWKENR